MEVVSTQVTKSPSKAPAKVKLNPYKYKKEDLDKFLLQYDAVDPKQDIKAAKKARTAIKKKITEIKKVHTGNKKVIMQYKKDLEAYSASQLEELIANLDQRFQSLDTAIHKIENAAIVRDQEITDNINKLNNDLVGAIFAATTADEIQNVQSTINGLHLDPNDFDGRLGEAEAVRTSMTLKAAARANEIQNAGGQLSQVDPVQLEDKTEQNTSCKYGDTEMINFLQKNSHPGKGWVVSINPSTGVQVYQVDDPKAPKDLRAALVNALDNHSSI
jgi:chromosome segregation ATPase